MKAIVGIVMGFFSGFLIYMMAAMVFTKDGAPSSFFVFITFFGGWILSSWIIIRRAKTLSKIFARGFLIGAAEWFAMIPAGLILVGKSVSDTVSSSGVSDASAVGATIGGGLVAFLTGGVSIFMIILCLLGFAISYFIGREMKPEGSVPTINCPECAELVPNEAKKCRYCGVEIT